MRNPDRQTIFHFKQFSVSNARSAMKIGTDGVLLGAWAFWDAECKPGRILDVGCGTGVISLMLAQRFADAVVTGVDIDADAVAEAAENFAASPWGARLSACHCDFNSIQAPSESYDLIVSNPPFFTGGALAPDEARRTARHQEALTFAALFRGASALLRPGGRIAVVAPAEMRGELVAEAVLCALTPVRVTMVRTVARKPPRRVLLECVKGNACGGCRTDELLLAEADGAPGSEYARLVSPFYLKF